MFHKLLKSTLFPDSALKLYHYPLADMAEKLGLPHPSRPPRVPWLSVVIMPTLALVDRETCMAIADAERCIAWALLEAEDN